MMAGTAVETKSKTVYNPSNDTDQVSNDDSIAITYMAELVGDSVTHLLQYRPINNDNS